MPVRRRTTGRSSLHADALFSGSLEGPAPAGPVRRPRMARFQGLGRSARAIRTAPGAMREKHARPLSASPPQPMHGVMASTFEIRPLRDDEADEACDLAAAVFRTCVAPLYNEEGNREFLRFANRPPCSPPPERLFLLGRQRRTATGRIASPAQPRPHFDALHRSLPPGQGIGRALWTMVVRRRILDGPVTVNSSPTPSVLRTSRFPRHRRRTTHARDPLHAHAPRWADMIYANVRQLEWTEAASMQIVGASLLATPCCGSELAVSTGSRPRTCRGARDSINCGSELARDSVENRLQAVSCTDHQTESLAPNENGGKGMDMAKKPN